MEWTAWKVHEVTLSADGNHAYVTGFSDDAVSWYREKREHGSVDLRRMLKDGVNGVDGLDAARELPCHRTEITRMSRVLMILR